MPEPLAFLNGRFIPAAELSISPLDAGFVLGVTIAEQLRTFGGQLFRLPQHLDRLTQSLAIVGVTAPLSREEMAEAAVELVRRNEELLSVGDDLGLSMFVTPGTYATFAHASQQPAGSTIGMHTYPIPFHLWSNAYERGQSLVVSDIRQVPAECWSPALKCRSRMHYHLADQEARQTDPGARALLLDSDGNVSEASTASVVIYRVTEGLIGPPVEKVLPGISVAVLAELAAGMNVAFSHRDLSPADVTSADEVLVCSTSPCVLPVVRVDGRPIGDGRPGPFFRQVLAAWSESVGIDIAAQARQFAVRSR